ncbi:collagen alpha-2(I) chain-like [Myiozetetes cayanensis]|uniref:collagen alpha-2(I) chain-like n=1 Tax=Myiozetetes cayanensis TaxID=478635 RepID=UPI002160F5FC|nr:collagen alpha-2(I) chain-like [Myiozetetes cayanensis]
MGLGLLFRGAVGDGAACGEEGWGGRLGGGDFPYGLSIEPSPAGPLGPGLCRSPGAGERRRFPRTSSRGRAGPSLGAPELAGPAGPPAPPAGSEPRDHRIPPGENVVLLRNSSARGKGGSGALRGSGHVPAPAAAAPGAGADCAAGRAQAGPTSAFGTAVISNSNSFPCDPETATHLAAARSGRWCLRGKRLQERKLKNAPIRRCRASQRREGPQGNTVGKFTFIKSLQLSLRCTSPSQARAGGSAAGWAVPGWGRARTQDCRARGGFPAPSGISPTTVEVLARRPFQGQRSQTSPEGSLAPRHRSRVAVWSRLQGGVSSRGRMSRALHCPAGARGAPERPEMGESHPQPQDPAQLVAAGMEQLRASTSSGQKMDLSPRHGSSAKFTSEGWEPSHGHWGGHGERAACSSSDRSQSRSHLSGLVGSTWNHSGGNPCTCQEL